MADTLFPLRWTWTGEVMRPATNHAAVLAGDRYVEGERYMLIEHETRSAASHNHFFACIKEGFDNLPEEWAERFPTSEHLRKWCLVKAGYCHERAFACEDNEAAMRLATWLRPADTYAVLAVRGATVFEYRAETQRVAVMGKARFQKSKQAVLDIIAEMIGVTPAELAGNAGEAA